MNQTFLGCAVVDSIPDSFRKSLNILTTNPVIKPQVRQKGLTAGQVGRCYWNASIMTQTIGGETIFGWMIYRVNNKTGDKCLYRLYGHGCWFTPEGKLVDVTNHIMTDEDRMNFVGFLPATHIKLVLNANTWSSLKDFYFVNEPGGVQFAVECETAQYSYDNDHPADHHFKYKVYEDVETSCLEGEGLLIDVFGVVPSFCELVAKQMGVDYDQVWNCMEPIVRPVTEETILQCKHDKTFDLNRELSKCYYNGKHIFDENPEYDVFYPMKKHEEDSQDTIDTAWNLALYFAIQPNFSNPSLKGKHKGMHMVDIPPSEKFLNQLPLPAKKSQLKQLKKIADGYGLTLREANVLSHPHFFPHPYLVKKAGGKVGRVKNHMLLAA